MIASLFRLGFLRIWRRKRGRQAAHPQQELVAPPSFFLQDEEDAFTGFQGRIRITSNGQASSIMQATDKEARLKGEHGMNNR
jgi:hypothetical protein